MKLAFAFQAILCLFCSIWLSAADLQPSIRVTSPDHPPVWYLGGDFWKINQSLRWDRTTQTLYLDVTYSENGEWPNPEDSDLYKTLSVAFPEVKADRSGNLFYLPTSHGWNIPLARVSSSFFGHRISPYNNVEISAHRRNGVLEAALLVKTK